MSDITFLTKYKQGKKNQKILDDLLEVDKVLAMSMKALGFFKKYTPVRKCITTLYDNKLTIEIAIKKLKNELEKDTE